MNDLMTFQNETIRSAIVHSKLQLLEVKQLAELENHYKNQCKMALGAYRHWQKQYKAETDVVELLYGQLKGIILRRHAENATQAYWLIRQDFRIVFERYLNDNKPYQTTQDNRKTA